MISLALATGSGRLTRWPHALLFVPDGEDHETIEVREAGGHSGLATALEEHLDAVGVDAVPPFVAVDWSEEPHILVFGDLEVTTNQPGVPMLSGAGSGSLIERRLRRVKGTLEVAAGLPPQDGSDLEAGTVPSGGFRLLLAVPTESSSSSSSSSSASSSASSSPSAGPATAATSLLDEVFSTPAPPAMPDGGPAADAEPDPDATWVPAARDEIVDLLPPRVDALACDHGHENPPSRSNCRLCDAPLSDDPADVREITRPPLGRLRFDDGTSHLLRGDLVIGRKPVAPENTVAETLALAGEKMSRRHAMINLRGWDTLIVDLGSTNGTVVVPSSGAAPIVIEPDSPQLIEHGAHVILGSRTFDYEAALDVD